MRSSLFTLLFVGLVVLAGCSGTTGPATTAGESKSTAVSTATDTPEGTPEPAVEPDATDPRAVADRHAAALVEAGSFRMNSSTSIESGNESTLNDGLGDVFTASKTATVDREAGRGLLVDGTFGIETVTYSDFERNRTYVRVTGRDGNVSYATYDAIDPAFDSDVGNRTGEAYGDFTVEQWLRTVNFSVVGVESVDGEYVTRLEAEGVDDHGEVAVWNDSVYERIHTTMLIDEDGIVREIRHEQTTNRTGEPMDATVTVRWTDIGSTTVEEPDWLDEAREEAAAAETTQETETIG